MTPVGIYDIYMGVRYKGTNGIYYTYPFIPLIVYTDVFCDPILN
jgi:hypothetical protein